MSLQRRLTNRPCGFRCPLTVEQAGLDLCVLLSIPHFRLWLNAQAVHYAVGVVKIADQLHCIEYFYVRKALRAQCFHIGAAQFLGRKRHFCSKVQQNPGFRVQICLRVVFLNLQDLFIVADLFPEILLVAFDSVITAVESGNDCGDQHALAVAQSARLAHQMPIEVAASF